MKLLRLGERGAERPVLLDPDGRHLDATPVTADFDPGFFAGDGIERLRGAHEAGALPEIDPTGLRIGAPIARPGSLLCIGLNYTAHAAESGVAPPAEPVLFYKGTNTLTGPNDDIPIPRGSAKTDWEVELAVVIGRRARYLASVDEAVRCIAGYTISNDLSEREFQLERSGGQWSKGKSCEGFNPLGPWLVTADEVSPQGLGLRSWVNGEPRQDSTTADMIFDVAFIVYHLSQFTVLDPGDIINTGTPQGVGLSGRFPYLKAGDVVEMEIDGFGRQRGVCVQS
ncbi:fumarylacetoacetate hydrolase family protein [Allorhizocola rhizosphaerae]|uniref:fumarylacetoacetate hydrolase family protein n=1 Tax=Allorhizocola rhizosphaerae TaxID=1872709 RepID=UPI000E3CB1FD|nr:fumarylacetoacetate hydrolase family protein [Allorhizocola rhizosphaerae]